jgi:hypothetical protein
LASQEKNMDDGQLWQDMRDGAPVAHCRAKIAHDRGQMIARRNQRALADFDRRRGSRCR